MTPETREALLAALAWQIEAGADEAIGEAAVDRFAAARAPRPLAPSAEPAAPAPASAAPRRAAAAPPPLEAEGAAGDARSLAEACGTLAELETALAAFEGVGALKAGARRCVFCDGDPAARVMAIGEAPGEEEDRQGRPFVGRSGLMLDRMLAAIGLDRRAAGPERGVYIANLSPWRPVRNRVPSGDEAAALGAFLRRHVALADPEFLLLLGTAPARAMLGEAAGIMRLRGRWRRTPEGRLAMPTLHPAYLLRSPGAKRLAWRDLLELRAALDGEPVAPAED